MMKIKKAHAQITVFKVKDIGSIRNGENSIVLIKHGVESLPDVSIVS